jgi:hypothetical protein
VPTLLLELPRELGRDNPLVAVTLDHLVLRDGPATLRAWPLHANATPWTWSAPTEVSFSQVGPVVLAQELVERHRDLEAHGVSLATGAVLWRRVDTPSWPQRAKASRSHLYTEGPAGGLSLHAATGQLATRPPGWRHVCISDRGEAYGWTADSYAISDGSGPLDHSLLGSALGISGPLVLCGTYTATDNTIVDLRSGDSWPLSASARAAWTLIDGIALIRGPRDLVALDARTGAELWQRSGRQAGRTTPVGLRVHLRKTGLVHPRTGDVVLNEPTAHAMVSHADLVAVADHDGVRVWRLGAPSSSADCP